MDQFVLVNNNALLLRFATDQMGFALLAAACFVCDSDDRPSR